MASVHSPTRGRRVSGPDTPAPSVHPVDAYAAAVLSGDIVAGPHVRMACERHQRDRATGHERGLKFDVAKADRALAFFPKVLRLPNVKDNPPFVLMGWQQFVIGSLFGWMAPDGYRRFRTAYIEVGKGNGKSPMCGGIGLFLLAADGETGAEVYSAAATRDQAKILFKDAVSMVDCAPSLGRRLQKSGVREVTNLAHLESQSFFRPVSSEGRGLDGKRVHGALVDELHVHPSATVVDKMRAGTKGRTQALVVEITNSGVDRTSVCYIHHDYSKRVVSGQIQDDSWFAYVCALDEGDDPFEDESCWIKANPNLGVSITRKYLVERVHEAKGMPAKKSETSRFNFCQWVDAGNPAIPGDLWRRCVVPEGQWDESALKGLRCIGGLDLSGTRDLTALARVYEPDDNGRVHMVVEFWTPGETMRERAASEHVPYDLWVQQGHVIATPGRAVDYRWVAQRISEVQVENEMTELAYDPYRIKYLEPELQEAAVEIQLLPHGQGFGQSTESGLWMPRSVELLEELIAKGLLRVKFNPALDYAAASAVHKPDPKGNVVYDKHTSTGRIDGIVAGAMAVGALMGGETGFSGDIFADESFWDDTPAAPESDDDTEDTD